MNKIKLHEVSTVSPPAGGGGGGIGGIEILAFKTNLANTRHIKKIEPSLNLHPFIKELTIDLRDCDKILRAAEESNAAAEVERIIFDAGHFCEELK